MKVLNFSLRCEGKMLILDITRQGYEQAATGSQHRFSLNSTSLLRIQEVINNNMTNYLNSLKEIKTNVK